MKTAIVNIGQIVTGDWKSPLAGGNAILTDGERIISVGTASAQAVEAADVVIDARGMTARSPALAAIKHGDIVVGRSRNASATTRKVRVASSRVMLDFSTAGH